MARPLLFTVVKPSPAAKRALQMARLVERGELPTAQHLGGIARRIVSTLKVVENPPEPTAAELAEHQKDAWR